MLVEAEKFSLCMQIWRMKQWLLPLSEETSYPFHCLADWWTGEWVKYFDESLADTDYRDCRCKQLLQAMWTDETLKLGTM